MKFTPFWASCVALVFNGCCEPQVLIKPEYVKVPVPCVVPDTPCTISPEGSDQQTVLELIKCYKDLESASEVCK